MDHTRHSEIYDVSLLNVTLIGAGGIGALTAIAVAKMGVQSLTIIDCDLVDDVNIPVQFHKLSDIGKSKAEALAETVKEFADVPVFSVNQRVNETSNLTGDIIISAVDSIHSRKGIWEAVKSYTPDWYLDARMAAEEFHLYPVDMWSVEQVKAYQNRIAETREEDIPDLPCTAKATVYCAAFAAGHIANAIKRIAMGNDLPANLVHSIKTDMMVTWS